MYMWLTTAVNISANKHTNKMTTKTTKPNCYIKIRHARNDMYVHLLLQLKNMIAALYASHSSGTANCFSMQDTKFGWKAIEDMLKREVERMKKNELVRVPGLKENYVYRDSWTRLNVKPAKIMQV